LVPDPGKTALDRENPSNDRD